MRGRRLLLPALVLVAVLALAACGGDDADESADAPAPAATAEEELAEGAIGGAESGDAEGTSQISVTSPAADLRVTLDRLLGEHALLAAFAMQKGVDGAADFEQIAAALEANTVDLGEAIGSVYGDEGEEGFLQLWRAHIGFFVDYTVATAEGNEEARQEALTNLDGYRTAFGEFLAGANPNIEADAIAEGLQMHVDQLTTALDTYAAGEYENAYDQVREAYAHMFGTGDALSSAIAKQFPEMFTA